MLTFEERRDLVSSLLAACPRVVLDAVSISAAERFKSW